MEKAIFIVLAIVSVNVIIAAVFFYLKKKQAEEESEPQVTNKPTEHKFSVGDWIYPIDEILGCARIILEVSKYWYVTSEGVLDFEFEDNWRPWTIKDAKCGDVIASPNKDTGDWIGIFRRLEYEESMSVFCYVSRDGKFECSYYMCIDKDPNNCYPATKEQREVLFAKMEEAGCVWNAETNTLSSVDEAEPVECHSETHKLDYPITHKVTDNPVLVGVYDINAECGCEWSVVGYEGEHFLEDFLFKDGEIYANVVSENDGDERTTRILTHHSGNGGERDDYFDVRQESGYDENFEYELSNFKSIVKVERNTENYKYMKLLYDEAIEQYYEKKSSNSIPLLCVYENFPSLCEYGNGGDTGRAFHSLVGMLFAEHLSELMPKERTALYKIGYEMGEYDKYSNIYGYAFDTDPNNARAAAGIIYAAMRGKMQPDIKAMRNEVGGSKYDIPLNILASDTRTNVGKDAFFIDLREFMPTAPAPYSPAYLNRPDKTYPNETKDEYGNLQVDRDIHEMIVREYNLDNGEKRQAVVQAIADKEGDVHHLFGETRHTEHYTFDPVFGKKVLGVTINPEGAIASLCAKVWKACSSARGILQAADVSPVQYGRLRSGCSWKQEGCKNSASDDRRNVLVEVEVEDNDGCKETPNTYGHYDEKGYWVYTQTEKSNYAESQKNALYANSYPSGHSAGIMGVAMTLVELFPDKADKILKAANQYAVNRTIARYHWTSDTINGRVLGTAQASVARASSDYETLLDAARNEANLLIKCM